MHLKTPSVDIAPVKLYPYVKSKTQTQMHELASCFCPYQLYPYDTLCTYGVKQLCFQGFFLFSATGYPYFYPLRFCHTLDLRDNRNIKIYWICK